MKNRKKEINIENVDILNSVEFDLSEAIKDLIWNIKSIKNDVEKIKKHLDLFE